MHVFGLWEEVRVPKENKEKILANHCHRLQMYTLKNIRNLSNDIFTEKH